MRVRSCVCVCVCVCAVVLCTCGGHELTLGLCHRKQFGHAEVVELLIAYGADVNHTLPDGYTTPLYVATLEGHTEVMDLLLGAGAIVSVDEDELLEYPEEQVQVQVQPKKGALKKATSARSFGKVSYYRTRNASPPHTNTSHTHTPHTRHNARLMRVMCRAVEGGKGARGVDRDLGPHQLQEALRHGSGLGPAGGLQGGRPDRRGTEEPNLIILPCACLGRSPFFLFSFTFFLSVFLFSRPVSDASRPSFAPTWYLF